MTIVESGGSLELWGGVECTVNRVGDRFLDQLNRTLHRERLEDLDRFAALGLRALRMPVLWETVAAASGEDGWAWPTAALERLRALGVRPIVGLVHHGSGPPGVDLLDEGFVTGLAEHARATAERFPWVTDWTPVNEPLTTARFSALYGHWYPHRQDDASFVRALLVETRATIAAMRAIRAMVPGARLVQTEDMGRTTTCSPALRTQAEFENARRWLSLDLLVGRVRPGHALWSWLLKSGATKEELLAIADEPCPPDVVGLNYYATSDRFLDERLDLHPRWSHGGNGFRKYADVHTTLGHPPDVLGHRGVLAAAWARYGLPVALTEVHQGAHRADQLRWLKEAWEGAMRLRAEGADVRAITLWALLGSHDWDRLVTEERGHYETGVYDVRATEPRPTALARMAEGLATEGRWDHPVLSAPGWWRVHPGEPAGPPVLVFGGRGVLGEALARVCAARRMACVTLSHAEADVASDEAVRRALARWRPWAIVHAAGRTAADRAPEEAVRAHVHGSEVLARAARDLRIPLVAFSTDQVFSSAGARVHAEGAEPSPRSVLGITRHEGERRVLDLHPRSLVVRLGPLFGGSGPASPGVAADALVSPLFLPDVADAVLDLLVDDTGGLLHLSHGQPLLGRALSELLAGRVREVRRDDEGAAARSTALVSERLWPLPTLSDALQRWFPAAGVAARTG